MSPCFRLQAFVGGVFLLTLALPTFGQNEQEPVRGYAAVFEHIDLLIDNYARFLARKYDLTEEQDEYTKALLRERSYDFLDKHEDELRRLVDRLFDVRTGGEMTQEELIEWGREVMPIYQEAKKLIVDGNNDWREILTAEQRKIHDEDVQLMYQSFDTTEEQLQRIVSGDMTVEEFRSPQRNRPSGAKQRAIANRNQNSKTPTARRDPAGGLSAARPADDAETAPPAATIGQSESRTPRKTVIRPTPNRVEPGEGRPEPPAPRRVARRRPDSARNPTGADAKKSETEWEKYVREFIEKYKLNDEQSQKAHAVLDHCEAQADRYRSARKRQIEAIDKQLEEARKSKSKDKATKITALNEQRKKLQEPIDRIFEDQLKPGLERLPTRAQRRAAEAAAAKKPTGRKTSRAEDEKKSTRGDHD